MAKWKTNEEKRVRRHLRIRKRITGTGARPRLSVRRTLNQIYAQIVDDGSGRTLVAMSTLGKENAPRLRAAKTKTERSRLVGKLLAEKARAAGIEAVTFDRGGYLYHGRVKALAEGAREGGLRF
jgi:large subunit ribosomal protein L18